jgi:cell division protein FtsB
MNKEITKAENELSRVKNENKAILSSINTSLDLNYIYEVATRELGMVAPNNNQVITYKSTLSNYVRQYEDIPEDNEQSILDFIIK